MMSLLLSGSLKELVIDHLDNRAVVTYSELAGLVLIVESLGAQCLVINKVAYAVCSVGLSAAVDAAARASHDLNHVVVCFAALDLFKQLSCVAET